MVLSRRTTGTGIDLGHWAVKVVRVALNGRDDVELTHWGIEPIRPESRESPRERARALERLLSRLGLSARKLGRVATSVGGQDVYLRQVTMPALPVDELRRALPYEAKKHLPLKSVADPCLEFQVLGAPRGTGPVIGLETEPEGTEVLLVAAPRTSRDQALEVLDQVGIDPHVIDVNPLPTVNAVLDVHPPTSQEDGVILVADLGERSSVLAAVQPQGGLYTRALDFSGSSLTERIAESLSLDRSDAEAILTGSPGAGNGEAAALLEEAIGEFANELEETIRYLAVRQRAREVQCLYLCGGVSLLDGLTERLSSALGIAVFQPDPMAGMTMPSGAEPGADDKVRLVAATGLAKWWEAE